MVDKNYYLNRITKSKEEIKKIDDELTRLQGEIQKVNTYSQQLVNKKVSLLGKIEGFNEVLVEFNKPEVIEKKDKELPKKIKK